MLVRDYIPLVLVNTENLPREEWLEWRRKGIGGSDAATIIGVSPFSTARDLYYDKLNIVSAVDEEDNWVQKEIGHLLEDLVAKIFSKKTGYPVYQVKKMFYHPEHPYMLADVDYFVKLPDGKTAILEIKTTNYNATSAWWRNGEEVVPVNYEIQGQHYMAVTNIDKVYYSGFKDSTCKPYASAPRQVAFLILPIATSGVSHCNITVSNGLLCFKKLFFISSTVPSRFCHRQS